jgi:hypothetical protein
MSLRVVLAELGLEPSWLSPSLEGGVCIAFAFGDHYADVQFLNSGEIVTTCAQKSGSVSQTLPSGYELRKTFLGIRGFLAG